MRPQALPRMSRFPPGSTASSATASSPFSNQAHEYVFQHDHLPGLLTHLLRDNAGEGGPAWQCLPTLMRVHKGRRPATHPPTHPANHQPPAPPAVQPHHAHTHRAVSVGGASIPLPFDPELWALGQATHAAWSAAKLPPTCAFYNLHGTGLSTPYDAQYGVWWYPVQASV